MLMFFFFYFLLFFEVVNLLLQMIGNVDFVMVILDILKKECVIIVLCDLLFSNIIFNGGENILDLLKFLVCFNNCFGNGVCVNGNF